MLAIFSYRIISRLCTHVNAVAAVSKDVLLLFFLLTFRTESFFSASTWSTHIWLHIHIRTYFLLCDIISVMQELGADLFIFLTLVLKINITSPIYHNKCPELSKVTDRIEKLDRRFLKKINTHCNNFTWNWLGVCRLQKWRQILNKQDNLTGKNNPRLAFCLLLDLLLISFSFSISHDSSESALATYVSLCSINMETDLTSYQHFPLNTAANPERKSKC